MIPFQPAQSTSFTNSTNTEKKDLKSFTKSSKTNSLAIVTSSPSGVDVNVYRLLGIQPLKIH